MCGRYGRWSRKQRLEMALGLIPSPERDEIEGYNIAPGTRPLIARNNSNGVTLDSCLWGLVPFLSKNPNAGVRPINAIAETAHEKPMFRKLLRERRGLVPADCFYEWKQTPSGKIPFCIRMADNEPFFFGGLWDVWHEGRDDAIPSFTILTTAPNELAALIHNRMPVIVRPEHYERWLDPDVKDVEKISEVFLPFSAEEMYAYPVSSRVNDTKNDARELIQPVIQRDAETLAPGKLKTAFGSDTVRELEELRRKFLSGEIGWAVLRIYRKDGSYEDVVLGAETEDERKQCLAVLQDHLDKLH